MKQQNVTNRNAKRRTKFKNESSQRYKATDDSRDKTSACLYQRLYETKQDIMRSNLVDDRPGLLLCALYHIISSH